MKNSQSKFSRDKNKPSSSISGCCCSGSSVSKDEEVSSSKNK